MVGRRVDLRVDDVLWTRPGAPEVPDQLSFHTDPWIFDDGQRTDRRVETGVPLEVGRTYVMPVVRFSDGWADLASTTPVAVSGDRVATKAAGRPSEVTEAFLGRPVADLVAKLETTEPYPDAVLYADLDPEERARRVLGDGEPEP